MRTALPIVVLGAILPSGLAAEEQAYGAGQGSTDATEIRRHETGPLMTMPPPSDPAVAAWQTINMEMHSAMSIDFTGDPDTDFMKGMIPHHQGAIDMAKVLLEHGTDDDTRASANAISPRACHVGGSPGSSATRGWSMGSTSSSNQALRRNQPA